MKQNNIRPLALVTGGASGMGLATVARLAQDGFAVVMVDRDAKLAEAEQALSKLAEQHARISSL